MRKRVLGVVCTVCVVLLQFSCMIIPASARTDFMPAWPLRNGFNIISLDYYQDGGSHTGIDIGHGNQPTQDVYAVADGTVVSAKNLCDHYNGYPHSEKNCKAGNLGNFVKIRHNVNGKVFYSQYGHLTQNSITVKVGQKVTAGTKIGKMGSSGNSMGPHLHLAIFQGDYTAAKAQKTFDFYKDNAGLMQGIKISKKLANSSKNYGTWIKENGTLSGKYYVFTDMNSNTQQNTVADNKKNDPSALAINLTNYPTSISEGDIFSLRGEITSNYNITTVKGYIINSSNMTVQSTKDTPNARSMDIRPANLNQRMPFDKLSAGSYYLRIEATDDSGQTVVSSKSFTVNAKNNASSPSKSPAAAPKMVYPNPGWYALTPACAPGMRLDVAYSGASSEDEVWIWGANGSAAQSWYLLPYSQSVGHYLLVAGTNLHVKMVLDVQYGGTESGTPVWLYESNDTPAQEWIFLDAGDGYYYIVPSENQDLALAVKDGSSNEGSTLVVETRNGSAGQKWMLISG